jgi:hypothetical protein
LLRVGEDAPEEGGQVGDALLVLGHVGGHVLDLGTAKDDECVWRTVDVALGLATSVRVGTVAAQGESSEDRASRRLGTVGRLTTKKRGENIRKM